MTEEMREATQIPDYTAEIETLFDLYPERVVQARITPRLQAWFVGQVMKATGGKANPVFVADQIAKIIMSAKYHTPPVVVEASYSPEAEHQSKPRFLWKHNKRGTTYTVIGEAKLYIDEDEEILGDGDSMIVYTFDDSDSDHYYVCLADSGGSISNRIISEARLSVADDLAKKFGRGQMFVVYRDRESKATYVREKTEFYDGRFSRIE